jgi:adenylylsulfate reductase subunit B
LINDQGQSEIRNAAECWDCMACIKACPNGALETQLPFMLAGLGASLRPQLYKDKIRWICKDAQGRIEEFEIPRVIESAER